MRLTIAERLGTSGSPRRLDASASQAARDQKSGWHAQAGGQMSEGAVDGDDQVKIDDAFCGGQKVDGIAPILNDHPNLSAICAAPRQLMAMKAMSGTLARANWSKGTERASRLWPLLAQAKPTRSAQAVAGGGETAAERSTGRPPWSGRSAGR